MTNDILAGAILQLVSVTAATWGAAQAVSTLTTRIHPLVAALVCGPLFAVAAYTAGFFPVILEVVPEDGTRAYFSAAFAGLIATLGAKFMNDYLYNPLRGIAAKFKGGGSA